MKIAVARGRNNYALLDSGDGKRLERFGEYVLIRPDPEAIWKKHHAESWGSADAVFVEEKSNPHWEYGVQMPQEWYVSFKKLVFQARLSPFKHTGIFPEQSVNWEFMEKKIVERVKGDSETELNVLNLFGYTGAASLVCAAAGARVTHVDASKPAIGWARENQRLSGLLEKPIRWIMDDAVKFVAREVRRGVKYDAIIMDPPIYGHGPNGEVWDFHRSFPELVSLCRLVLSEKPLFFLVNAYAISSSAIMLNNVLSDYLSARGGTSECGEIALEEEKSKRLLSTGIFARWSW